MTPFGAKVRELRKKNNRTLKEMAEALSVSSAYLSALEHGKRGTPTWYMVQRIITYFNVIWDEAEELQRLAELSDPRVTIDTGGLSPNATELTNMVAMKISGLSEESIDHLLHQLRVVCAKDNV
ncbi:XRE family transcriptional regulator [Rhodobacteraceae bacterium RKSG542]|uniref:helix-turn-helix domain-containing protein n=1 Tax=Pseudovibrio flavus TaxID=2529854 RepID=UPI0012BC6107|nr:helix-turn-helix domain-containing protein [Pseudovibrio flavus]MTI18508.1 XRE family transcriptional regulator [Pseudovibrio flavus]